MTPRILRSLSLALALIALPAGGIAAEAPPVSKDGTVTVTVTPLAIDPAASEWRFQVVLDTHTVPLDQDMTAAARLAGAAGEQVAPLSWQGDPAGGHHRKGILLFSRPAGADQVVLTLKGIGGVGERVFRWRTP